MKPEVPPRRNLESLKKEAKRWLAALQKSEPDARARLARAVSDPPPQLTLRDVQHALALEHGFDGWSRLKEAVEQREARVAGTATETHALYEEKADALLEAYRTGTPEAMARHHRHTWHRRAWPVMRTYVQLDLGKRSASAGGDIDITRDDARQLVAIEHGFADWRSLESFTTSLRPGRRVMAKPLRVVLRKGPDEFEPIAASRDWDEVIALLAEHPEAALSGQQQLTDGLLEDLSRRCPTLTGIGLSGCRQITDAGIRHLAAMPTLQHLDLGGTSITDAGLQVLRDLRQLRTLVLSWNGISAAGVRELAHCDALEFVDLGASTEIGDAGVRVLAGKRKLRELSAGLTDTGMALLNDLPVFKSWHGGEADLRLIAHRSLPNRLTLRGSFTDAGMQQLRGLDGLFGLDVYDTDHAITAASLRPLSSLPHLTTLSVDANDEWMPKLAALPHLRALGIQDTTAGDAGFEALSRSRTIEYIWGRRCHNLRARGFKALAKMPALRGLSVSCLNVDDEGVAALPEFPALRELMPMDVPDAGYRHIGRCERLESLILMYCRDTTDAATGHITGLRRLTTYFNSYTTITDRTPELLSTMDSLERVTFDSCHGLTDAGVARLARLPNLREVHVSGRGITPAVRVAFPASVRVEGGG